MPLVEVRDLKKWYPLRRGMTEGFDGHVRAVDGVTFTIERGRILGLVGESGCGKSTLGKLLLNLLKPTSGSVSYDGQDLFALRGNELRRLRKRIQIIFQDPFSSLNPRLSIASMLREILVMHRPETRARLDASIGELLETVGLNAFHAGRYPHEFSSGQRQRICIARALAVQPEFIVCDEPVSALDVSIQAQIINLLLDLRENFHLTYMFISHDLHVVRHISDEIAVMYLGKIVELGPTEAVSYAPLHPYARALVAAAPEADPSRRRSRTVLDGEAPLPLALPGGCAFHPRCLAALPECATVEPRFAEIEPGRWTSCLLYDACRSRGSECSEMSEGAMRA